jgi:hypothetical protein
MTGGLHGKLNPTIFAMEGVWRDLILSTFNGRHDWPETEDLRLLIEDWGRFGHVNGVSIHW